MSGVELETHAFQGQQMYNKMYALSMAANI